MVSARLRLVLAARRICDQSVNLSNSRSARPINQSILFSWFVNNCKQETASSSLALSVCMYVCESFRCQGPCSSFWQSALMGTYRWLMTPCSVFLQLEDNSGLESRTDEFGIGSGANECMEILRIGNAALTSLRIGNADGISSCDKAKVRFALWGPSTLSFVPLAEPPHFINYLDLYYVHSSRKYEFQRIPS